MLKLHHALRIYVSRLDFPKAGHGDSFERFEDTLTQLLHESKKSAIMIDDEIQLKLDFRRVPRIGNCVMLE